jgi:hypothetical protein
MALGTKAFPVHCRIRRAVLALACATAGTALAADGPATNRLAPPAPAAGSATSVALASHRAVYELTLARSTGARSPTAARGRIAFDFTSSPCAGYVQNFRQLTELQPAEGSARVSDMSSATYEDSDGKTYDFKMRTKIDDSAAESVDGKASRSQGGGALSVELAKPKPSKLVLGSDIVFPTAHLKRILAAAKAGESLVEVKVYDGSETGAKVYDTTTVIGHPSVSPPAEAAARIPPLEGMRRWPVSIAYFEGEKPDSGPSYTLSFDLYENGISRALKLDYGDFVLAGEMSRLEIMAEPACGAK